MSNKVDLAKALVCGCACIASGIFHGLCAIGFCAIWSRLLSDLRAPLFMDFPIGQLVIAPVTCGSYLLSLVATFEIKIRILKRKTEKENLTSAFKAGKDGDFESGVSGTNMHKECTKVMTRLTFRCLVSFYAVAYSLESIFCISKGSTRLRCWGCAVCLVLSTFLAVISVISSVMNFNLASCICDKMKKSNETC